MIAEVISIGDELTSGQRLDTNSQWLSQQLGDLGVKTLYHTTVADDLEASLRVFSQAFERANVVVASGGLGPTADDLTREVVAKVAGVELTLDTGSLEHIRGMFTRHKREMPERNMTQAMFPAGSTVIFNPNGTAPGIDLQITAGNGNASRIFALPGVPAEMKEMFAQTVAPAILAMQAEPRVIRHRRIKCFGVGESQLESMLPDLIARGREPSVGITVHAATITLRVTATGKNSQECYSAMEPTLAIIRECLGTLIFGEEDDELEHAVVRLLQAQDKSLATVEFGTRGLLAQWLSEAVAGTDAFVVSQVFNNPPDISPLDKKRAGVSPDFDLASREYVQDLAVRFREKTGVDYCLAIGDFPEPTTSGEPPVYHFSLASEAGATVFPSTLVSHPAIWRPRAAKQALNLLRLQLLRNSEISAS